jgi:hypothetical protein
VTQNNSASKGLALEVTHHPACDLAAGGPESFLGELVERIIDVVGPGQTGRCVDFVWWHPVKQVLMQLVVWCAVGWWSLRRGCWYEGGT